MWTVTGTPSCVGAAAPPAPACDDWSNPATWGGALPGAGAAVDIPVGRCVRLDTNPPALGGLTIRGTLTFADTAPRALTSAWIHVSGGALEIGSAAQPFQNNAVITLTDTNTATNVIPGMGTRALLVSNGRLALYGRRPAAPWTKLADHAAGGATALQLAQPMADWASGDMVVVAPTDFYGIAQTDRRLLGSTSAGGSTLHLTGGTSAPRWGRLQYPAPGTPAGLSLAPAGYVPPASPAPAAIDQRAEVGNLTRGIVIQGADDLPWQQQGFGAHTMVMGSASRVVVDGVHFRRVGQAGLSGRYGFHWHMLSYASGIATGDATGNVLRHSVISESRNRCITIHGTNGVEVRNNICHDIRGHAIFLEDANERRNVIEDNLVLQVRGPLPGRAFLNHDIPNATGRGGPSGMWLTHPDNTVRRNAVADIDGNGYWLAFPRNPIGHPDSLNAQMRPRHTPFGVFDDNVAHSVNLAGVHFDEPPVTTPPHGAIEGLLYQPTANTLPASDTNPVVPFALRRITTYKNREGIWNRVNGASYEEWVSADNTSKFFIGSTALSHIRRSLVVGTSLNNANTWQTLATSANAPHAAFRGVRTVEPPAAFASYHGGVAMRQNTIINFPFVDYPLNTASGSVPTGAFANDDYYLRPVERSLAQNQANVLINAAPGRRSVPAFNNFVFAGAVVDYEGLFGPAGNNWVYDLPFFTAGGGCVAVPPAGQNGQSCSGQYFGAEFFVLDRNNDDAYPLMALAVSRRDPANPDAVLGTWSVAGVAPAAAAGTLLPNMRHFAMRENGIFVLTFPGYRNAVSTIANAQGPLTDVRMTIGNMHTAAQEVVLAVEFHGAAANVFATTFPGYASAPITGPISNGQIAAVPAGSTRRFTARNTRADLLAQPGDAYFYDAAARLVWIKLRGGLVDAFVADPSAFSDETLYRPFYLRVTQ
ncbi:G8 domain-containing protein [Caenimonas sedimenti]|nr:G8 domain-containing protein [Caenimonas sedimenti]